MPIYKITDPESGKTFRITGDSPPSEDELSVIFSGMQENTPDGHQEEMHSTEQNVPGPEKRPSSEEKRPSSEEKRPPAQEQSRQILSEQAGNEESIDSTPDVLLDIPMLKVEEIKLVVDNLEARVALGAQLANLVRLDVGAHVGIAKVDLDIRGVEAQALLKVRLKKVYEILARALETLDKNPEILRNVLTPVGQAVGGIGSGAGVAAGELGKGTGQAVGELGTQTAKSIGPGGPLGESVKQTTGDVGQVAKGVTAPKGPVRDSIKDAGQGLDKSIESNFHDKEDDRRKLQREDKKPVMQPAGVDYDEDAD